MSILFQTILSMSVSGALLIAGVLVINRLLKTKCSRRWQYYIWLLVIARLLIPFGPRESLMARISPTVKQAVVKSGVFSGLEKQENAYADISEEKGAAVSSGQEEEAPADSMQETMEEIAPTQGEPAAVDAMGGESAAISSLQGRESDDLMRNGTIPAKSYIGLIWFIIALGILIRKIIMYRRFMRHVMAGAEPVSDFSFEKELSEAQRQAGVEKTVALLVNPLVSSPMLIGFRRPCIVLPGTDVSEKEFRYIVTHELVHEKRRDFLYKWLVQFAVCLHWFNPLVYVMSREISKACELSCDEAVLEILGFEHAADYGKTLLDAMAAVGRYKEPLTAVSLSVNKRILKERLGAIMNDKAKTRKMRIMTAGLTVCMALGVFFVGIYPAGTVNVKILREKEGKIIGAAYMSDAEVTKLFGDMDEGGMSKGEADKEKADNESEEAFPRTMIVKNRVCRIREGVGMEFKVVGLVAEGEELTVLGVEEGSNGQLWYLLDKDSLEEKPDPSVEACYIRADLLREDD